VKMPAHRVSTQVLPLADSLSAEVNREKYHRTTTQKNKNKNKQQITIGSAMSSQSNNSYTFQNSQQ